MARVRPKYRRVVHYWGPMARLKVTYEIKSMLCPFCNSSLVNLEYSGSKIFVTNRKDRDYVRDSWEPLFENGVKVWHEVPRQKLSYS